MNNMWKLLDFENPDSLPEENSQIWLCRWAPPTADADMQPLVDAALWSEYQRQLIKELVEKAPAGCVYLWLRRIKPHAPRAVSILNVFRCKCQRDTQSPCDYAYEDDGYCVVGCEEPHMSSCQYRSACKEAYCT